MAVKMEGMFSCVGVVEDYVDDVVFVQDESVAVYAVDGSVAGCGAG